MIQKIRTSRFSKVIASYLAIQLIVQMTQPSNLWALTSGPSQPEFNSFTPIGTSDMVDLASGNFNYNIPIMDVGGYPLNLSYDSGVNMDQEASWVGLGWNLNVGQINRQVRGIPDDFKGDEMKYETNMKDNVTVGVSAQFAPQLMGFENEDVVKVVKEQLITDAEASIGVNLRYNNYTGISFTPSWGLSFDMANLVTVGMDVQNSAEEGLTISPDVSAGMRLKKLKKGSIDGGLNAGLSFNSRRGLMETNISPSMTWGKEANAEKAPKYKGEQNSIGSSGQMSFSRPTISPRKRTAFKNKNGTISFSIGATLWGLDGEVEVSALGSVQKVRDKGEVRTENAYGYEFTGHAEKTDILDYNRQNDQIISKSTLALPVTNYTYDLYSVNGQGVGGMFRGFRSQVGHVNDELVEDEGNSLSTGGEFEGGAGIHVGGNFVKAPSYSKTGVWSTNALKHFRQAPEDVGEADDAADYEPVYHKFIGEPRIDENREIFEQLGGYAPISLEFSKRSGSFKNPAASQFAVKEYTNGISVMNPTRLNAIPSDYKFKVPEREKRNQHIQKLTKSEIENLYMDSPSYYEGKINDKAESHHTAEIRILKPDGATYVFGETAYNTEKQEVTFAIDTKAPGFNCATGLASYTRGADNTSSNDNGIDNFFDRVETPPYAHTYLLSSVLSSDYEDRTSDGPSQDDFGAYTQFEYVTTADLGGDELYKWRMPYKANHGSYDAGLNTNTRDQKANYIYGEKEVKYAKRIKTKTHVAIFDLSARKDGRGVADENGGDPGVGNGELYKIDKIRLYSRPEYEKAIAEGDEEDDLSITAIKTAHFTYNYDLNKGIPNNSREPATFPHEITNAEGKLTLKSLHFTYRASEMGKYTPYIFNYDGLNPDYSLKSYDLWGNYKPVVEDLLSYDSNGEVEYETQNGREIPILNSLSNQDYCGSIESLTAPEYPYVQQEDKKLQDAFASAWSLTSIELPSGGLMEITYESDDYNYVQDKNAMQMFKVVGAGYEDDVFNSFDPTDPSYQELFTGVHRSDGSNDAKFLYVELPDETDINFDFDSKYLKGIKAVKPEDNKPIYFRFLMNMTKKGALNRDSKDYDYVTGYFLIDPELNTTVFQPQANGPVYAAIPMDWLDLEGGVNGNGNVNPISKAGWYFGRRYLNNAIYGLTDEDYGDDLQAIAKKVSKSFNLFSEIIKGANGKLRGKGLSVAKIFNPEKSWIRLSTPDGQKLGGGVRVKQLIMKDNWQKMVEGSDTGDERYNKMYGQIYDYALDDGTSSGVATYEPAMSKENPWVEPFYNKGERLAAPKEVSYVETPFGAEFFPSPSVTYSKVTVSNLDRPNISDHATGKVVTKFFTSREFPTKVDMTDLNSSGNSFPDLGAFGLNLLRAAVSARLKTKNKFGLSQGYVIHTNDMNGKMSSQEVFQENAKDPISSVVYKYATEEGNDKVLDNKVPLVSSNGKISTDASVGVDYDVVTDFRQSFSISRTDGLNTNFYLLGVCPACLPLVTGSLQFTEVQNVAQSVITTKVIHTTAILKEKIATDLGASVSTINEAWDAETGDILLTRTINEYDDEYFNFNFPAYWSYEGMGQASKTVGVKGEFQTSGNQVTFSGAQQYLYPGDELMVGSEGEYQRLWVVSTNGDQVTLIDFEGETNTINDLDVPLKFKVVRSGYRNQQMANMASVTMMKNPLVDNQGNYLPSLTPASFIQNPNELAANNLRLINASAVEYDDLWNCQCEGIFSNIPKSVESSEDLAGIPLETLDFNPFVSNVKGEWRAKRSFAYLTERTKVSDAAAANLNTRREGYFKEFVPFYNLNTTTQKWERSVTDTEITDEQKWTFASEVTEYSPFGAELENRDALTSSRYSSAQYGYNYTLPTAVASNSRYKHMGVDNFEDYGFRNSSESHFNFKTSVNEDGDAIISSEQSHTGQNSLRIREGDEVFLYRELLGEKEAFPDRDIDGIKDSRDPCPDTRPLNSSGHRDLDGNDIGDECEDSGIPTISNVEQTVQFRCRKKQVVFYINGRANQNVELQINTRDEGPQGWARVFINGRQVPKRVPNMRENFTLDDTGRILVQLQFEASRREGGSQGEIELELAMSQFKDGPMVDKSSSERIIVNMFGGRCKNDPRIEPLFNL